jgi:hypothetical protein
MATNINMESILMKISKSSRVQAKVADIAERRIETAKKELLNDFNTNNVTQEIEGGADLAKSKVLPMGYGNLFSFLGFKEGREPTTPVRQKLEAIRIIKKPRIVNNYWVFKILVPSKEELEQVSRMDWESGRSWLNAVTKGLSGFSHYIFSLSRNIGRSGHGIQAANSKVTSDVRSGSEYFGGTSYVFGMLSNFVRKIKGQAN